MHTSNQPLLVVEPDRPAYPPGAAALVTAALDIYDALPNVARIELVLESAAVVRSGLVAATSESASDMALLQAVQADISEVAVLQTAVLWRARSPAGQTLMPSTHHWRQVLVIPLDAPPSIKLAGDVLAAVGHFVRARVVAADGSEMLCAVAQLQVAQVAPDDAVVAAAAAAAAAPPAIAAAGVIGGGGGGGQRLPFVRPRGASLASIMTGLSIKRTESGTSLPASPTDSAIGFPVSRRPSIAAAAHAAAAVHAAAAAHAATEPPALRPDRNPPLVLESVPRAFTHLAIHLAASLDKTAYPIGGRIAVNLRIANGEPRRAMRAVRVSLVERRRLGLIDELTQLLRIADTTEAVAVPPGEERNLAMFLDPPPGVPIAPSVCAPFIEVDHFISVQVLPAVASIVPGSAMGKAKFEIPVVLVGPQRF
ncbi:hypothetical protein HK105_207579 [Polyrhizophydium stewartii]|uniref:Arrestin C-terminal-like domain-containing protein n=1 Tax=Polyrhizophydium stewartii TaxID=2732419 RepID=A0ABR4N050_9FUNG